MNRAFGRVPGNWTNRRRSTIRFAVVLLGLAIAGCGGGGAAPTSAAVTSTDTWTWDGKDWTYQAEAGPPWRDLAASVYDRAHKEWMLFGGAASDGTRLNDTWTWDGRKWTEHFPENPPSPRAGATAVYDVALAEVVMFGGQGWNPTGGRTNYNDTWAWNGSAWVRLNSPSAPPSDLFNPTYELTRSGSGQSAYDPVSRRVILYGDSHESDSANCPLSTICPQTWSWDGLTWQQEHPVHPLWRGSLYEDLASRTVNAWGVSEPGLVAPQYGWRWSGGDWVESKTTVLAPAPEVQTHPGFFYAGSAYGSRFGRIFAFGGSFGGDFCGSGQRTYEDGTWRWDGTWQLLTSAHHPSARSDAYLIYDPTRDKMVLWGGIQSTSCILSVV